MEFTQILRRYYATVRAQMRKLIPPKGGNLRSAKARFLFARNLRSANTPLAIRGSRT